MGRLAANHCTSKAPQRGRPSQFRQVADRDDGGRKSLAYVRERTEPEQRAPVLYSPRAARHRALPAARIAASLRSTLTFLVPSVGIDCYPCRSRARTRYHNPNGSRRTTRAQISDGLPTQFPLSGTSDGARG